MPATACGSLGIVNQKANDSALCSELKTPVDDLANSLLDNQEKTPANVINKGTVVIRGYDAGCAT